MVEHKYEKYGLRKESNDNTWMMKIANVTKSSIIGLEEYMAVMHFKEIISDENIDPSRFNLQSKSGIIEFVLPAIPTLTNLTTKIFGKITSNERSKIYIDSIELIQVIGTRHSENKILQKIEYKKCVLHTMILDISLHSGRLYRGNYKQRSEKIIAYDANGKEGFGISEIDFETGVSK